MASSRSGSAAERGPGAWIVLLILLLTVWNPATLALYAASAIWTLDSRPLLWIVFLAARLVITSIGVAAGIALWLRRPGAVWLAKLSLMLFAIEAVVRLSTRIDLVLIIVAHNAGWYLYLQLSRHVRAVYGLESQR